MSSSHQKTRIALKKALSSLKKVEEMIEKESYCIDTIQQNLAVMGLLRSINTSLLEDHLGCCVQNAIQAHDEVLLQKQMEEILKVMKTAQSK